MISYIIVSEALWEFWQYGIVSAACVFCVLLCIVVALMRDEVRRERNVLPGGRLSRLQHPLASKLTRQCYGRSSPRKDSIT